MSIVSSNRVYLHIAQYPVNENYIHILSDVKMLNLTPDPILY